MLPYTAGVTTTQVTHVTGAARAVVLSRSEQCCYRTLHLTNKDTVPTYIAS